MVLIPCVPYYKLINELYNKSTIIYFGINFKHLEGIESFKLYFKVNPKDYDELYSEYFPNKNNNRIDYDNSFLNTQLKNILNSFPTIGVKIKTNGLYYLTFYHLIQYTSIEAVIISIDTQTGNIREYIYKPYSPINNLFINMMDDSISSETYIELCNGTTIRKDKTYVHNKISFIPEAVFKLESDEYEIYEFIKNKYRIVGNAIDDQLYKAYYFITPKIENIFNIIYDIMFNIYRPKLLLNPSQWKYNELILNNLKMIQNEFVEFKKIDNDKTNDYITMNEAVEWIEKSEISAIIEHPYKLHEGYKQSYSKDTWVFIPIYADQIYILEKYFLDTINLLKKLPTICMAGFMILKKGSSIEWHKHNKKTKIIHYNISLLENNKENIDFSIMSGQNEKDTSIETILMNQFGSICMFNPSDYHKTVNESNEDRISFVIEINS